MLPAAAAWFAVSYEAARPQPWRDEIASWSAATRTVPEILELGRHIDGVLVPYYLFLHFWIGRFGDSVESMRMPSMIAMTATAAACALLGRRLFGNKAGLLAGLLFAVVPAVSRYGQEIRGTGSPPCSRRWPPSRWSARWSGHGGGAGRCTRFAWR